MAVHILAAGTEVIVIKDAMETQHPGSTTGCNRPSPGPSLLAQHQPMP